MATAWVLTKGMQNLWDQFYAAFPNADRTSSGKVGDLAHQLEGSSGHDPDLTGNAEWKDGDAKNEVRAIDLDDDLRCPGVTMQMVIDHLRRLAGVDAVIRYMIYDRTIYEASNDWRGRAYTGPSPHTEHAHFSGARTQASDENKPHFDFRFEELTDVAIDAADITKIAKATAAAVWAARLDNPQIAEDPKNPGADDKPAGDWLRYVPSYARVDGVAARVDAVATAIKEAPQLDEAAVVAGILAGLPVEAIAAAIPPASVTAVIEALRGLQFGVVGTNS